MAKQLTSAVDLGLLQKQMQASAAKLRRCQSNIAKAVKEISEAEAEYNSTKREFDAAFASVAAQTKVVV